jgi:hypothetical protein
MVQILSRTLVFLNEGFDGFLLSLQAGDGILPCLFNNYFLPEPSSSVILSVGTMPYFPDSGPS